MRVLLVASEATPFAKTGGLADVAGSLPAALERLGCDVTLVMPAYREVFSKGHSPESTGVAFEVPIGARRLPARILEGRLPGTQVPVFFAPVTWWLAFRALRASRAAHSDAATAGRMIARRLFALAAVS